MSLSRILSTFQDEKVIVESIEKGKYVEKSVEGVSLKGVLQRGRLKLQRERGARRTGLTFRPSSITYGYCRRLKVAQLANKCDIWDAPKRPSEQLTMDIGSNLHELVQGYFWSVGILKGTFKCLKCEELFDALSPEECPKCSSKRLKYKEVIMRDPDLKISGRCDGILMIEGEEHLVDIKTIKNRTLKTHEREFTFEDLETEGPKSDHVVQVMLYLYISGKKHGHLLYLGKNNSQIRTFYIPYDYSVIEPYLTEIRYLLDLAKEWSDGKKPQLPVPCGREICPCHEY